MAAHTVIAHHPCSNICLCQKGNASRALLQFIYFPMYSILQCDFHSPIYVLNSCRGKAALGQVEKETASQRDRERGFLLLEISKPQYSPAVVLLLSPWGCVSYCTRIVHSLPATSGRHRPILSQLLPLLPRAVEGRMQ